MEQLKSTIEKAWDDRSLLGQDKTKDAVFQIIELLDKGEVRVAEPTGNGWQVNEWIKKAVIMYFPLRQMEVFEAGPLEFHDKIPLKHNYK